MISSKEKSFVSAVVYLHDDEETVEQFCIMLFDVMHENFEKYEIIYVNDYSTDRTMTIVKDLASKVKGITSTVINMSVYQGVELCMNAGIDLAIGDFVFEFDSIMLDYEAGLIMDVYARASDGFDIVAASPKKLGKPTSFLFYSVFNLFSSAKYSLRTERFRLLSRRAINRVQSLSNSITYRKASYANCGLKMDFYLYSALKSGNKCRKASWKGARRETAFDTLILFTDIANKLSVFLTFLLFSSTLLSGIYTLTVYFSDKKPIEGWTTIMILLSCGFSGMFLLFTIVIKYLSIIVGLVLKKKKYLVSGIEKVL